MVGSAATLHVDDLIGPSSPDCGAVADPCHRIQDAVVRARGLMEFPGGDRIEVAPGVFEEDIAMTSPFDSGNVIDGSAPTGPAGTQIRSTAGGTQPVVQMGISGVAQPTNLRLESVQVLVNTPAAATEDRAAVAMGGANSVLGGDVDVSMVIPENDQPGVAITDESQLVQDVTVGGAWNASALSTFQPSDAAVTVRDSFLTGGGMFGAAVGGATGTSAKVERSTLRRIPATGEVVGGAFESLTIDSSLITGGATGVVLSGVGAQTATIRHTTIDSGSQGVVVATAPSSAQVVNSIVLEQQGAGVPGASVTCSSSDVPNQVQGPNPTVTCPSNAGNTRGNSFSTPLQLFESFPSNLHLRSGSPAIETGSAAALAAGEPATDREGNPRILDGNGDCRARRDKGAYEKTGLSAACPAAPKPGPGPGSAVDLAPVITKLKLSRKRFRAADGRRRARVAKGRATRAGTRIGYTLSEAAKVSFAVERRRIGRRVGGTCRRASARNRRRRRCVRWVRVGRFSQQGKAGRNRRRFQGRLKGRKLATGRYRFTLRARDKAGNLSKRKRIGFRVVR